MRRRYKSHLDWFDDEGGNHREVTCLLYLQPPDWLEGGALSMKPPGGGDAVEIAPVAGRLVLFFARLVEHEITPAAGPRRRLALQMWLDRSDGGAWPEEPLPGKGDPLDGDVAAAGGTGML